MDNLLGKKKSKKNFLNDLNKYLTEDLDDLKDIEEALASPIKKKKPTSSKATTSIDENAAPSKKTRKVRIKEEIQQERIQKEINKIQRELNASKNTKCEQYLFCHCSNLLLNLDPQIQNQIRTVFVERKIANQFVFEDMELAKVFWEKKRISAELDENMVELQFGFLVAVDGGAFKSMVDSKQYDEFIENALADHCSKFDGEVKMTIAVIGEHRVSDSKINWLNLGLFDKYKVQLRFVHTFVEFSYLVAQIHRTLAKLEKKSEISATQMHINVEKGIREGENLVEDWWSRMLLHMYRLPEECRRAIVETFPTPFVLMDNLDQLTPGDGMQYIADIECSNGRRVGPAIAQKLYLLMTSEEGTEIIDRPGINV